MPLSIEEPEEEAHMLRTHAHPPTDLVPGSVLHNKDVPMRTDPLPQIPTALDPTTTVVTRDSFLGTPATVSLLRTSTDDPYDICLCYTASL